MSCLAVFWAEVFDTVLEFCLHQSPPSVQRIWARMAVSSSKGDTYKDGSTVGWGIITIEHTRAQAMEIVKLHFQSYADTVAVEVLEDRRMVPDKTKVEFVEEALQKMTKPDHFTGDPDPEVPKRLD